MSAAEVTQEHDGSYSGERLRVLRSKSPTYHYDWSYVRPLQGEYLKLQKK